MSSDQREEQVDTVAIRWACWRSPKITWKRRKRRKRREEEEEEEKDDVRDRGGGVSDRQT
jgi:hypothetical protein